eukprot:tig00020685_g12958.t1
MGQASDLPTNEGAESASAPPLAVRATKKRGRNVVVDSSDEDEGGGSCNSGPDAAASSAQRHPAPPDSSLATQPVRKQEAAPAPESAPLPPLPLTQPASTPLRAAKGSAYDDGEEDEEEDSSSSPPSTLRRLKRKAAGAAGSSSPAATQAGASLFSAETPPSTAKALQGKAARSRSEGAEESPRKPAAAAARRGPKTRSQARAEGRRAAPPAKRLRRHAEEEDEEDEEEEKEREDSASSEEEAASGGSSEEETKERRGRGQGRGKGAAGAKLRVDELPEEEPEWEGSGSEEGGGGEEEEEGSAGGSGSGSGSDEEEDGGPMFMPLEDLDRVAEEDRAARRAARTGNYVAGIGGDDPNEGEEGVVRRLVRGLVLVALTGGAALADPALDLHLRGWRRAAERVERQNEGPQRQLEIKALKFATHTHGSTDIGDSIKRLTCLDLANRAPGPDDVCHGCMCLHPCTASITLRQSRHEAAAEPLAKAYEAARACRYKLQMHHALRHYLFHLGLRAGEEAGRIRRIQPALTSVREWSEALGITRAGAAGPVQASADEFAGRRYKHLQALRRLAGLMSTGRAARRDRDGSALEAVMAERKGDFTLENTYCKAA